MWEEYRSNCFLEKTNRKHGLLENIKLLSINALEEKVKQESDGIGIRECKTGAIPIMGQGCVGTVLLVIQGELAETVWSGAQEEFYYLSLNNPKSSDDEDLPFAPASFLIWMEDYLQQRIWFYQMKRKSLHGE